MSLKCKAGIFILFLFLTSVQAQKVAIVQNFAAVEIDTLVRYLQSMGIDEITRFNQEGLNADSLDGYDLVVWDDLSYAAGGLSDADALLFNQVYQNGQSLYFIGDDLPYSANWALSPAADTLWAHLIHLTTSDNYSNAAMIVIEDSLHPVTNGPFGQVEDFPAYIDVDPAYATNQGERILAKTDNGYHIIVAFEDSLSGVRVVTQNTLAFKPGDAAGQQEREKLFKNAVSWLLDDTFSGVQEYKSNLPETINLRQNYPNPFNPSTTIEFTLPGTSWVTLKVFNILGQPVSTLVEARLTAGAYQVDWSAEKLPSGIYYYRLQADNVNRTGKGILMK